MTVSADYDLSVSNEELLALCKRQDQDALRVLFRRHERPVYGLLLRMLSSPEDTEEALAEVFVKVWRGAANFKGGSKFTTWLFRIASNTARDYLRSRRARHEVSIEDVVVNEAEAQRWSGSVAGDPVRRTLVREDMARIVRAMQDMSEDDRLLVSLYHFQQREYDEISQIMDVPASNLKVRLFRARQRLKKLYAEQEKGDGEDELQTDTTESSGLQRGASEWA